MNPELNPVNNPYARQSEMLPTVRFGEAAKQAFELQYPAALQTERLSVENPLVLTATRNAEMHFTAGRREKGWNELEGKLYEPGWTDVERSLSVKLTAAENECGLEAPIDQTESLELTLDFLDQSASEETRAILDQFSTLPDGEPKLAAVESLLIKVEMAMCKATTEGKSQALRKRLRDAQQTLFIEKGVIQDSYAVRNPDPIRYEVYPPAPKREVTSRTRRR